MLISLKFRLHIKPKNVFLVILMLQMCVVFSQKKVIVIDPGHGGKDTGAIGINGLQEKDVALNVANEIVKLNKTLLNYELDIYLTRYKDTLISLADRTRLTKTLKADIFISLHCNAAKTNSGGIEIYVHNSDKPNTNSSITLGSYILNEITEQLSFKNRGVKFANFQVLREAASYPNVLIEMGFITNTDEASCFSKTKNIRALALTILMSLAYYFND